MKKTTAPAMSVKPTTPPTAPPAIAPVSLLCELLLPELEEGGAVLVVVVCVAEPEIVLVGIVDDAVNSGVSTTNFWIRRDGMFERLTSICLSSN